MNAMEPKTARDPEAAGSRERTLLLLLMVSSVVFNYVDRSALSVAAPALASDLALGPRQMGVLLSAFFWSYAGTMAIAGWLVDRYHTTWVFVAGFLVWSLATLATGMAGGMQSLLVFRLLLGWGQSISFPAYSRFIVSGFPAERRALPNALIDAGAKLGPAVATLIGGNLIAAYGWRSLFFILGGASLISLGPWCVWPPRVPAQPPSGKDAPSILAILRRREAWGTFFGNSAQSYGFFFLFTWFPTYLVRERGLSLRRMALFGSTPFAASALASVTAGWASDHLIRRGFSPTRVRKTVVVTGILGTILLIPAAAAESLGVCMALVIAACIASGVFSSNHWAISQTLAGPNAAGRWTGLQNTLNNLAGAAAPWVAGEIVARTGTLYMAFVLAAAIAVCGAMSYLFLVPEVAPVDWSAGAKARKG